MQGALGDKQFQACTKGRSLFQVDTSDEKAGAKRLALGRFVVVVASAATAITLAVIAVAGCAEGQASTVATRHAVVESSSVPCTTGELTAVLGTPGGAAGSRYYELAFTNRSGTTCSLAGYSGISVLSASDGRPVGAAAQRQPSPVDPVTLKPGQTATEQLRVVNAANYPASSCRPTAVGAVRVFPPAQSAPIDIPVALTGCGSLSVPTIYVWPVGTR